MTQEELGKICGTTKQTIFKYESGIVTNIPMDRLCDIANALHVSPAYLMGWEDNSSSSASIPEGFKGVRRISLPVLGSVACGEPQFAAEDYQGTVSADASFDADFCLIAKGDSMINIGIYEGTIVFIRQQQSVENGEVAVVLLEDEATLKRVYYYPDAGVLILHAENPRFKDITLTGEQLNTVRILGKAVFYQNRIL